MAPSRKIRLIQCKAYVSEIQEMSFLEIFVLKYQQRLTDEG